MRPRRRQAGAALAAGASLLEDAEPNSHHVAVERPSETTRAIPESFNGPSWMA